jgi:hypothetical protein
VFVLVLASCSPVGSEAEVSTTDSTEVCVDTTSLPAVDTCVTTDTTVVM